MTTLITGATGFIGAAVARRLLAAGHRLRALVRPEADRRNLAGLDVEIAPGDLTDSATLRQAVAGCEVVFHVAADYRIWCPDPAAMHRTNVDGTRTLIEAALESGVRKVVYTSSVAVLGLTGEATAADEDTPAVVEDMIGPYKRSKFLAEQAVMDLVRVRGAPVVIVNPSTPIGPRDIKPTPTGRLIVDAASGRMPGYVDTGLNVVHVDDVAEGQVLALERGQIGRRYILGGQDMTLQEILRTVANHVGRPPPRIKLPHGLVLPIAYVAEAVARITGREPLATVDGVKMARKYMYFSSARAASELGYAARPAATALADAVDWFLAEGYVHP